MTHVIALAEYKRESVMQTMFRATYFMKQVTQTLSNNIRVGFRKELFQGLLQQF